MKTITEAEKRRKHYVKPTMERLAIFPNEIPICGLGKMRGCLYATKPEINRPKNTI